MEQREPSASTDRPRPSLSISNLPIRAKVAMVLVAPLALAAALTGWNVLAAYSSYQRSTDTARQAAVLGPATRYQSAIEQLAVVSQRTESVSDPAFQSALAVVGTRAAELQQVRGSTALDPDVAALIDHTLHETELAQRGLGFLLKADAQAVATLVAGDVSKLTALLSRRPGVTDTRLQALDLAVQAHLALSKQQMEIGSTGVIPEDASGLFSQYGAENLALTRMVDQTGLDARLLFLLNANEQRVQTSVLGVAPSMSSRSIAPYDALIPALVSDLERSFADSAASALRQATATLIASSLAFLVAIGLAALVARRIVRSIRTVHDETLEVANERLPAELRQIRLGGELPTAEPIAVSTTEETGQLARAVDSLHRQALRLAADEAESRSRVADMFTTLSRRNTSLVNQQLGVIEHLERDEQDPQRLESLFKLDHLASRMRRNAQSLVVLADAPSRAASATPLSVHDTLMAALGGVQDYQRVRLEADLPHLIDGTAVPDVVHIVAELVDNALSFSPPTTDVTVAAVPAGAGVSLSVTDAGLGIKAQDLERFRAELRAPGEPTAETARRMGLYVVSRLARRHGLTVELDTNDWGGITASVALPPSVLTGPAGQVARVEAEPVVAEPVEAEPVVAEPVVAVPVAAVPVAAVPVAEAVAEPAPTGMPAQLAPAQPPAVVPAPAAVERPVVVPAPASPPTERQPLPQRVPAPVAEPVLPPAQPAVAPVAPAEPAAPMAPVPPVAPIAPAAATAPAAGSPLPQRVSAPVPVTPLPQRVPAPVAEPSASPAVAPAPAPAAPVTPGAPAASAVPPTDLPRREPVTPPPAVVAATAPTPAPLTLVMGDPRTSRPAPTEPPADDAWSRQAVKPAAPTHTASGLPIRQRGNRPVPGSVDGAAHQPVVRDPEALRQRLSAHAAGVSRGRHDSANATSSPSSSSPGA